MRKDKEESNLLNDSVGFNPFSKTLQPTMRLSVIFDTPKIDESIALKVQAIQEAVSHLDVEVILTCADTWREPITGVKIITVPSRIQSYRWDEAATKAKGELLGFVDPSTTVGVEWVESILEIFSDPEVAIAGGAVNATGTNRASSIGGRLISKYWQEIPFKDGFRVTRSRYVKHVSAFTVAVRASVFREIGGFQAPTEGSSAWTRLYYKVQTLINCKIISDPRLTTNVMAPSFPRGLLTEISKGGRDRGYLAKWLPDTTPVLPEIAPLILTSMMGLVALTALILGNAFERVSALGLLLIPSVVGVIRSLRNGATDRNFLDETLAGLASPLITIAFGLAFIKGYFGPDVGEISPPRERARPLRVLILNWRDVTHPWSGGAENYVYQIAKHWVEQGIDVSWLTERHAGSRKEDIIDQIRIYRVGGRATLYPRAALTFLMRFRGRFDVVIDCENGIPFFSPVFTRLPTVLLVHHVHQEIFRTQLPKALQWIALGLEARLMPWIYRNSQVVAVSNETKSDLLDLGFKESQTTVIKNGVHPPAPNTTPRNTTPTIFCMGRLKPQKSVDVLIRSIPYLIEQLGEVRVDILGQGPDRQRLEKLTWSLELSQFVKFHGYVTAQMRDDLAGSAWIAACPSAFEGWGVVCMEASARGLPVVASNVAGLRESVRDGETGLLFPYGDPAALSGTILELIRNEPVRLSMGSAGIGWAKIHTWDGSANTFAQLLYELVPCKASQDYGVEKNDAASEVNSEALANGHLGEKIFEEDTA